MRRWSEDRPAAAKLKLLIVTDEMEVGGSQRQIAHLARGIDASWCDVTVAYFRQRSFIVDEIEATGVRVVHLPKRGRIDSRFVAAFVRELRDGAYDVVHAFAFSAELWSAVARRALPRRDRPALVTSIRGTYDWYGPLQWRLKRWVTAESARVVANSRVAAAYAAPRLGLAPAAIDVVYNGIAPEAVPRHARQLLREQWGVPALGAVVLFVGRLVEVKNVDTLIRAAALLKNEGRSDTVVICGQGSQRGALESLARRLDVHDAVRFVGERTDVAALVDASDLLVLTSRQEGLSNVILEAMRGMRPVVATRTGGNVEIVEHERTGLLFDVGDHHALAAAIRRLADDPSLRRAFGQRAAERVVNTFSVGRMVHAMSGVYRNAARGSVAHGVSTR